MQGGDDPIEICPYCDRRVDCNMLVHMDYCKENPRSVKYKGGTTKRSK